MTALVFYKHFRAATRRLVCPFFRAAAAAAAVHRKGSSSIRPSIHPSIVPWQRCRCGGSGSRIFFSCNFRSSLEFEWFTSLHQYFLRPFSMPLPLPKADAARRVGHTHTHTRTHTHTHAHYFVSSVWPQWTWIRTIVTCLYDAECPPTPNNNRKDVRGLTSRSLQ
jgi:hypothetical protein